jgi:DNA-binding YbaB/EbfC family protein
MLISFILTTQEIPVDLQNISQFMEQAKKIQEQLKQKQALLSEKRVVGKAGGGSIEVEINCEYVAEQVKLQDDFRKEELPVMQELIKAAFNDATRKVTETVRNTMTEITSQMSLPDELLKGKE